MLRRPLEPGQYTSIAFAETLVRERIAALVGSIGDYDNVLAETTIGLFKNRSHRTSKPIFRTGPLRTLDDVEYATME